MNQGYPQGGLAALLASQGRGDDKVLVHMTPGEVQGLQALALASGGSLERNPRTGLLEAGWLKNLLPAIAGFTLNRVFPGLGSTATSAIVGGATGLIEGSFKKGLNAGFSAYSGANVSEGLRRAAAVRMAKPKTLAEQLGLGEDELTMMEEASDDKLGVNYKMPRPVDLGVKTIEPITPMPAVSPVTPQASRSDIWEGIKALGTEKGRKAFATGLEGGYTSPFGKKASQYVTSLGFQTMLTPDAEDDAPKGKMSRPRYYIPGEYNPRYGQGYGEWLFQPGYYSDTYPGYADGGMVMAGDERFADGGEVMVSPEAVLPQQITGASPFTQDRAGLESYYESLLVPPDNTPRDTSALQAYLDALRARLKVPYQPVGVKDWASPIDTTTTTTGGTSPTPDGTDPFATGVTGTPIEFLPPPEQPERPSVPGIEHESVGPNIPMSGTPDYVEPEKKGELTIEAEPGTTTEEFTGSIVPALGGTPDYVEPEKKGELTIEAAPGTTTEEFTGSVVPSLSGTPDYAKKKEEAIKLYDPTTGFQIDPRTGNIMFPPGFAGTGLPAPQKTVEGTIYDEAGNVIEEDEQLAKEEREKEKAAKKEEDKGIIEKLLDEARENKGEIAGYIGSAIGGPLAGAALEKIVNYLTKVETLTPEEQAAADEAARLETEKILAEAKAKREQEEKEAAEKAELDRQKLEQIAAETAAAEGKYGRGAAYPILPSLSQERFGLAKGMGDDVFGPTFAGTIFDESGNIIEENVDLDRGMAAGGPVRHFAAGGLGSLQQYAVGGKLVNGAGDGMSDDIKANISGVQEARLADGEFVIPADVVSHLGNGSTDAGAKQLYAMMDRIRKARTGRTRQAPEVEVRNYMPA